VRTEVKEALTRAVPVEVLGAAKGRQYTPEELARAFA
jgi:hypothetical protein